MKRLAQACFILMACAFVREPALAQMQTDSIAARGNVTAKVLANSQTVTIAGTTPNVSGGNVFLTNNSGPTTITNFTGGIDSQQIVVVCGDTNTTIQNNANIALTGGTNYACALNQGIQLAFVGGKWIQTGTATGGGGGGSSPAGNNGDVQIRNGTSLSAAHINDNGATIGISEDTNWKGPNPSVNLFQYGAYLGSTTPPTISCTTAASSANLTCSGGTGDFAVGHGVAVPMAGPAPVVTTPNAPVSIVSLSISSNVATIAMASTAGFSNGSSVVVSGASDSTLNGTYTGVNTVNAGTFTASITHANCSPCTIGGSATVVASTPALVTPVGQVGGSTTYNYKIVARDFNEGLSAASTAITTTSGWATLGVQTYSIANNGCSWNSTSGLETFTTTAAHNIPNQPDIEIFVSINGVVNLTGAFVTAGAPTATTVTVAMQGIATQTQTCPSGGTLKVVARNFVQWTPQPYQALGWLVYRSVGAGAYSLVAVLNGQDSSFYDWGYGSPVKSGAPAVYIPSTPPSSPQNGTLAALITAINGTTVTLSSAASASLTTTVLHDNSPNVMAACNSLGTGGLDIYYPGANSFMVFNSPLKLYGCSSGQMRHILGTQIVANEPIIPKSFTFFEGRALGNNSQIPPFMTRPVTNMFCGVMPCFLLTFQPTVGGPISSITLKDIAIQSSQPYVSGIYMDQDATGAGITSITLDSVYVSANKGGIALRFGGGFYFNILGGFYGITGANGGDWGYPPAIWETVNQGLGQNTQGLSYLSQMKNATIEGGEFYFDTNREQFFGNFGTWPGQWEFSNILSESNQYPILHFNTSASTFFLNGISVKDLSYADPLGNIATPLIELGDSRFNFIRFSTKGGFSVCGNGSQPIFASITTSPAVDIDGGTNCGTIGLFNYAVRSNGSFAIVGKSTFESYGVSTIGYAMGAPTISSVNTVSGSLAAGTYYYSIRGVDRNGNVTTSSPVVGPFTSNGSQALTLNFSLVPGQAFTMLCRSNSGPVINSCAGFGPSQFISGTSFTDNTPQFNYFNSNTEPALNANGASFASAQAVSLGASGLSSYNLALTGGGFSSIQSGTFTANRTITWPDASGTPALLGVAQTFTQPQTFTSLSGTASSLTINSLTQGSETQTALTHPPFTVLIPGALTATSTAATWTLDKAITVTRVQIQTRVAPSGCSQNAVIRLTDGSANQDVAISGSSNDSGGIAQNYVSGAALTISVQTPASGCATSPGDAQVVVQYRNQ